ncbi:MAG: hypothetical protein LQ340_005230 [Diploschistes diacapsis]|nr:MAG: hypothetical protein LQ340_005230 [Diploschistes diacapsis]
MLAYLKSISYNTPTSLADGPFQHAYSTSLPFFAWLNENPPNLQVFSNYKAGYRAGRPSFYPISERLAGSFDPTVSPMMLVDVGGGQGHDLGELKAKYPDLPGKQDQSDVVLKASEKGYEATAHDFFTAQPVKHARAYYLHSVLHDWSYEDRAKILQHIVPAMKSGYSKMLLNEIAVPEQGASWTVTSMDWFMMALGAMRERKRKEWEAIWTSQG